MRADNPNLGLLARAKEAGRLPAEQARMEQQAFRVGYLYCDIDSPDGATDNYVHQCFQRGRALGQRINGTRGKLFT